MSGRSVKGSPDFDLPSTPSFRSVGRNVPRKEGIAKVTGAARYIDDLSFPGMLHGATVRSTIARGEILSVTRGFDAAGFTVADFRDIPGKNVVALIEDDQPCLAEREVRHAAEPILLLAHEDREKLLGAKVAIEYREDTPVYDPEKSPKTFKEILIEKGKLARGFREADLVVEGEYRVGLQEQLYIETNGVIAVPENGGVTVYGSLQCPYYVHKALRVLLGLPPEKGPRRPDRDGRRLRRQGGVPVDDRRARVPPRLEVRSAPSRSSTTASRTCSRRPSGIPASSGIGPGVTRDGRLTAMDIDVLLDGGAYVTLSPVVLSRGVIHATGPYRCDHVRVRGRVTMTNTPPNGAFRGFGAPQTQFAAEVHMERIAEALGMDPVRLREINAFRPGGHDGDRPEARPRLQRAPGAARSRPADGLQAAPPRARRGTNRGIGLALFFHGSGFTGGGEVKLASKASLELTGGRAHPRRLDRDRPGHAHDARADRRRRARHSLRPRRSLRGRHRRRARQRPDRGLAHLHGRRQDPRELRRGHEGEAR